MCSPPTFDFRHSTFDSVKEYRVFLFSIIRMVLKRALRNFSLLLCTILGLIITVTLVSSIPLYSDAAIARLLQRELKDVNGRPPGTLLISYFAPNDAPPLTFSATPTTSSAPAQNQFPTGPRVTMDTY